jgi:hypothetical protein
LFVTGGGSSGGVVGAGDGVTMLVPEVIPAPEVVMLGLSVEVRSGVDCVVYRATYGILLPTRRAEELGRARDGCKSYS